MYHTYNNGIGVGVGGYYFSFFLSFPSSFFLPSSFLPSSIYFLRRWGVSSRLRNLELRLRLGGLDLDVRVSLHDYTAFFGNKFWFWV